MQTKFDAAQLADPTTAAAAGAIRNCVHCGFCTATCPTYVLLGNELDSPRGRIYLVKDMLEKSAQPSAQVVKHLDRCLSCLACETTCPSGVSYRRIIDKGRAYVEEHFKRTFSDRMLRWSLANVLPYRGRFRIAMALASAARPFAGIVALIPGFKPVATMLRLSRTPRSTAPRSTAPRSTGPRSPSPPTAPEIVPAMQARAVPLRIGIMRGCVEGVLEPDIQAAAIRLLQRAGCTLVRAEDGCCGALSHHMGREAQALAMARDSVDAWTRVIEQGALDAIVMTASGCGTVIRDYGVLLRDDPVYAQRAARVAALACDLTELLDRIGMPALRQGAGMVVAYHAACSVQHGQKLRAVPERVLRAAGFEIRTPTDAHLCCGSAGVYNILQPDIAAQLGKRKADSLAVLAPVLIVTGNVGCMTQIGNACSIPVVHVAELLDWATGGPAPRGTGLP